MNKTLRTLSPKLMLYGAAVLLVIAIVLLGITMNIQKSNAALIHTRPSTSYAVNQQIHSGNVIMSVQSVKFEQGKKPFIAPAGKQYAIIDFWIKNISDAPIQALPSNDTYMKNVTGDVSYLSPFPLEKAFRAGEIAPGEAIHGDLSYLVDTSGTVKLFVDAKWSGIVVPILIQGTEG